MNTNTQALREAMEAIDKADEMLASGATREAHLLIATAGNILRLLSHPPAPEQASGEQCPNCPNQGWFVVNNGGEPEQQQCEFCETVPNSIFNIRRAATTTAEPAVEPQQETDAELLLRELASYLGVGGYNATTVDVDAFRRKIYDGIRVYSNLHGIASRELAEQVMHMDLATDRGLRAKELARQVLGVVPLSASPAAPVAAKPEQRKQSEMYRELVQAKAKPEQQAQADPEVVAHGFAPNGKITDALAIKKNDDPEYNIPLITLQSHREAMAKLQDELESLQEGYGQLMAAGVKKDAALKACVDALEYTGLQWPQVIAAITQAEGAMKP